MSEGSFPNYNKFGISVQATAWGDEGSATVDGNRITYTVRSASTSRAHNINITLDSSFGITEDEVEVLPVTVSVDATLSGRVVTFSTTGNVTTIALQLYWTPNITGVGTFYFVIRGFTYVVDYYYTNIP